MYCSASPLLVRFGTCSGTAKVNIYPTPNRLLLRRAKFAQSQHTCGIYRRYSDFDCTKAKCTQSIPPGSRPADDDHEVAMCVFSALCGTRTDSFDCRLPLLWYNRLRGKRHPPTTRDRPMDTQPNPIPHPRLVPCTRRRPLRLRGPCPRPALARLEGRHPCLVRPRDGLIDRPRAPERRAFRGAECRGILGYQPVY